MTWIEFFKSFNKTDSPDQRARGDVNYTNITIPTSHEVDRKSAILDNIIPNISGETIIALIPAYNEGLTIDYVVKAVKKHVDRVIVVDDGSRDDTKNLALDAGASVVSHQCNLGKGSAVKTGLLEALRYNPDIVVMLDGDGQHNPDEIPRLLESLKSYEFDAVVGTRCHKNSRTNAPSYRRLGLRVLHLVNSLVLKNGITDTQSGFRAFRREAVLKLLDTNEIGYNVEMEQIKILTDKGVGITEVPISVNYKVPFPSKKNPFKHGLGVLLYMLELVLEKRPLLIGLPGFLTFLVGIGILIYLLNISLTTHYLRLPLALISVGFLILGLKLVLLSMHKVRTYKPR